MEEKGLFKKIPSVNYLAEKVAIHFKNKFPFKFIVYKIRIFLSRLRSKILSNTQHDLNESYKKLELNLLKEFTITSKQQLTQVVNATGIIIHTNLGRVPLGDRAFKKLHYIARGYSNLEITPDGKRGDRIQRLKDLFGFLTGSESVVVVNNDAAAVYLILTTLARDKEVVIARSELVEIGGKFRLPEVIKESGVKLVEVGTTNRSYIEDYKKAITENTALILKVHKSNFTLQGFTCEPELTELVSLSKETGIPLFYDQGDGCMVKVGKEKLTVKQALDCGVDIVSFSGDKLLGGPQAGIILGKKKYLAKLSTTPIYRALRIGKLTLSALEGTLEEYLWGEENNLPVWRMINLPLSKLRERSIAFYFALNSKVRDLARVTLIEREAMIGGGSLAELRLPGVCIFIKPYYISVEALKKYLFNYSPPIVTCIDKDCVVINLRTVKEEEENILFKALVESLSKLREV